MGSNLDMVALEAAARAVDAGWDAGGVPFERTEREYQQHCRDTARYAVTAYLSASGIRAELDGLRSIVQTYSDAHEAAVRQGVQMRDAMEETR